MGELIHISDYLDRKLREEADHCPYLTKSVYNGKLVNNCLYFYMKEKQIFSKIKDCNILKCPNSEMNK